MSTAQAAVLWRFHITGTVKDKYGLIKSSHVFMFQDKEACQMNELIGKHPLAREILHIAIEIGFL